MHYNPCICKPISLSLAHPLCYGIWKGNIQFCSNWHQYISVCFLSVYRLSVQMEAYLLLFSKCLPSKNDTQPDWLGHHIKGWCLLYPMFFCYLWYLIFIFVSLRQFAVFRNIKEIIWRSCKPFPSYKFSLLTIIPP